jgi:hypothetical protein
MECYGELCWQTLFGDVTAHSSRYHNTLQIAHSFSSFMSFGDSKEDCSVFNYPQITDTPHSYLQFHSTTICTATDSSTLTLSLQLSVVQTLLPCSRNVPGQYPDLIADYPKVSYKVLQSVDGHLATVSRIRTCVFLTHTHTHFLS